jgi:antitoxin HicB
MIHVHIGHHGGRAATENSRRLYSKRNGSKLFGIGFASERDDCQEKSKKTPRSARTLSSLDDFLKQQGKLEEFEAVAIKETLAWQLGEAMKAGQLSRKRLAERMGTSRSQINRLLDPKDGNVTLTTLQRAAKMVGRSLKLELV